jgi:hypothetical protein
VPNVAVVAHSRKSFGGGLRELRKVLAREDVTQALRSRATRSGSTRAEAATTARSA